MQRTVLKDISLKFEPGEFVVLLGHSGSGKSTLLNLISGIDQPTERNGAINGLAITELDERSRTLLRRDHIGFVFQFFNLIPTHRAGALPQRARWAIIPVAQQSALKLLEQVELADRLNTFHKKLGRNSSGLLLPVPCPDPKLVLADEPTGNLDGKLDSGCCKYCSA